MTAQIELGCDHRCMRTKTIRVHTGAVDVVHDLSAECADFVAEGDFPDGLLQIFVPHATAGVAILEVGAGSDEDLLAALETLLPRDERWMHRHGSTGHGRSHVMPALVAPSMTVPVVNQRLLLGTWQSICLVDLNVDNPVRDVHLSMMISAR